jgi:hypothetical protein
MKVFFVVCSSTLKEVGEIPIFMIEIFLEKSAMILTGIIVTFIASFLYSMNARGFIAKGRYRKKEEAVIIYLAAALILGILTPFINEISTVIIGVVPALSIMGLLIIGANFIIHYNIERWRQTSLKSLLIYLLGIFLFVVGIMHISEKFFLILQQ